MPRLRKGRSKFDLILKSTDPSPLYLTFDRPPPGSKQRFEIRTRYAPTDPGVLTSMQEWYYQNGPAGAGTTIETPGSNAGGACEYGEFVWLRRLGVVQPAGVLTELQLPPGTAALTSGQLDSSAMYNGDLYITTRRQYVVKVPNAGGFSLAEQDCGAGAVTAGIATFMLAASCNLYVGCTGGPIYELSGATWTAGAAGTERAWLQTPDWTLGANLATGGALGTSGSIATRLVGTDTQGTGFYHVAGDPKVAANWSSLARVGTGGAIFPINRTVQDNRTVWFSTGQGVYGVDGSGRTPDLTEWVKATASVVNGQAIAFWDGLIFVGHESGLFAFAPDGSRIDLGTFLNFGTRTGKLPIFGRPQVLAPAPDGLYVGYFNGSTNTGYVGILLKDPNGAYRWSMAESVHPGQIPTFIRQQTTPTGDPGLFIGTVDAVTGALHLYRQSLPRYGNDPETDALNGGPFRAQPDWSIRLSRWNGHRGVPNTLRRLALEADYLGDAYPDNTVLVGLANDGSATFAPQGTATESPRWTGTPKSGSVRASSSQIKLSVHNATTQPVVINSMAVTYTERPERTAFKTYPIRIAEGQAGGDPFELLNRLARTQSEDPFQAIDEFGNTVEVLVEDFSVLSVEEDPGKPWVCHCSLTLSTTRTVAHWSSGDTYDTGSPYA